MMQPHFHPALAPRPTVLVQELGVWNGAMPDPDGAFCDVKYDGWRLISAGGAARTRQGMPYQGIRHIERALAFLQEQFAQPMAFDGEFVVGEGTDTLAMTKAHQDSGWKGGNAGRLYLFDALPLDRWEAGYDPTPLYVRRAALEGAIRGMMDHPLAWEFGWTEEVQCPLSMVDSTWACDAADVKAQAERVWACGGEGVVVKRHDAPYQRKRSNDWMKVKYRGQI